MRFCEDLGVDPSDVVMLVISYHCSAKTMCEYSKEEFSGGMLKVWADGPTPVGRIQRMDSSGVLAEPESFRQP